MEFIYTLPIYNLGCVGTWSMQLIRTVSMFALVHYSIHSYHSNHTKVTAWSHAARCSNNTQSIEINRLISSDQIYCVSAGNRTKMWLSSKLTIIVGINLTHNYSRVHEYKIENMNLNVRKMTVRLWLCSDLAVIMETSRVSH